MDWELHKSIRLTAERYYRKNAEQQLIDIPTFDLFVTEIRKDWERAGYDLNDERDLFKLWGALQVTCAAAAYMLKECETREEAGGALKVFGTYGNMMALFLREMTKAVPAIPVVTLDES